MPSPGLFAALVSLFAWLFLALARGGFWRAPEERLQATPPLYDYDAERPAVVAVIPARDEAAVIERAVRSVLNQWYNGPVHAVVVDDSSTDGTGDLARRVGVGSQHSLSVIEATPRPNGWAGKLWALESGIRFARENLAPPRYWLFTDADVEHGSDVLEELVQESKRDARALVSRMVLLHCESSWEKLLIPAFVFFFCKLYPFAWVRDAKQPAAAAAGGCVLISDEALRQLDGLTSIKDALIDDCSLAAAVKARGLGIALRLTVNSRSIRPYESLDEIWSMVARSAYTQLEYSPLLLAGTVAGMALLYLTPPLALASGIIRRKPGRAIAGGAAWAVMSALYIPTMKLYRRKPLEAALLPAAALLYTMMTIDSALRHYRGKGGAWKGRTYSNPANRPDA